MKENVTEEYCVRIRIIDIFKNILLSIAQENMDKKTRNDKDDSILYPRDDVDKYKKERNETIFQH